MTEGRYGGIDEGDDRSADEYPVDELERAAAGLPPLSSEPRQVEPPQLVQVSVLLWVFAAALLFLASALMIVNMDEITAGNVAAYEEGIKAGDKIVKNRDISAADVKEGTPGLVWLLAIGGAMLAVLVLVFAFRARVGTRSARAVLIALTALIAAFAVFMPEYFINYAHWASVVVAVVAIVPLFLPQVADYFPRLPTVRRSWRDR